MERLYWVDQSSFPLEQEQEPLFQEALNCGYRPYFFDGDFPSSAFGIQGDHREAFYISRGRGRQDLRGTLWEVLLRETETNFRLGPYFDLPEHACVVVCGVEAVSLVNNCWLAGREITDVIKAARFFNRRNMEALQPLDLMAEE